MPKKHRLTHAEFARIPRAGSHRLHGEHFSLMVTPLTSGNVPKAACVISKKVAARAVDRNMLERRCREILRPRLAGINKPAALLFYAKSSAPEASFAELVADIERLLARGELRDTMLRR